MVLPSIFFVKPLWQETKTPEEAKRMRKLSEPPQPKALPGSIPGGPESGMQKNDKASKLFSVWPRGTFDSVLPKETFD